MSAAASAVAAIVRILRMSQISSGGCLGAFHRSDDPSTARSRSCRHRARFWTVEGSVVGEQVAGARAAARARAAHA